MLDFIKFLKKLLLNHKNYDELFITGKKMMDDNKLIINAQKLDK